jgi:hypothetical protein
VLILVRPGQARRAGKQVYYRIVDPRVRDLLVMGTVLASGNTAGVSYQRMRR